MRFFVLHLQKTMLMLGCLRIVLWVILVVIAIRILYYLFLAGVAVFALLFA